MPMIKTYLLNKDQHDALIRAARHGKEHPQLSDSEHIMCAISEEALSDITHCFNTHKQVYFTFHFSELQIPALCNAEHLFIADYLCDPLLSDIFKKFPDFDNEIEVKSEAGYSYYICS